jgi:hypothetical protein
MLFIAISYSVDLHGLSHSFENDSSNDSKHCELCIITHQKEQSSFALEPNSNDFNFISFEFNVERNQNITSPQTATQTIFFRGQLFNRPPPFYI